MFRDWVRGFVVDPKLEQKFHKVADDADKATKDAQKLIDDAHRKLRKLNGAEVGMVFVGGLLFAGTMIGVLKQKLEEKEK